MKKALLPLFLLCTLSFSFLNAQVCVRDSSLLMNGKLLSPAPWSPDSPFYNLKLACINEPYNQSVTINVPEFFDYNGTMLQIKEVSIPTTNGVGNYPVGMTYSCDPPNCVFPAKTLGCILLNGTPNPVNQAPDTLDLKITATITLTAIPFPITLNFPGDAAPNNHYYLILNPQGQCASDANEAGSALSSLRILPNPVGQLARIEAVSAESGAFLFEVFDLLGNRLQARTVQ
ncbi:MAG: hypothetical protein JNK89_00740, partial [Saprospiraceae bacterium]|nr:hypothetical protein [Saprospiraceae bacterium]